MPLARRLLRNPGTKLAALALAYLFWLAVVEQRQVIRQLEVPLRFENLGPSLALVRDRPSSVVVRVQAAEPIAKELVSTDVDARVDLGGFRAGSHLVRLGPDSPQIVPRRVGVRVLEVFPAAFVVVLEPKRTAEVPLHPLVTGSPAPGYQLGEVTVEPPTVRIEGPASSVERTTAATTREVDVTGRTTSLVVPARVDVPNPDVVVLSAPETRVRIAIREIRGERTYADIPIAAVGLDHEVRVVPRVTRVTVAGPERILASISREDVLAFVDVAGLEPRAADLSLPVKVSFTRDEARERLEVVSVGAPSVSVRIVARRAKPAAAGG